MNKILSRLVALGAIALMSAAFASPAAAQQARAILNGADGAQVGTVILDETPFGVLLTAKITALPPGTHAFHIHEIGNCTPPDYKSAGGHYAPAGNEHGLTNPKGKHAGDLPNIHVAADGTLEIEILADAVSLVGGGPRAGLFDTDGSAFVVHAGADDYASNPAGAAGARIACGLIEQAR
jgi:Cu-Zn family superoxide dismutase